jgi:hypothetical protein
MDPPSDFARFPSRRIGRARSDGTRDLVSFHPDSDDNLLSRPVTPEVAGSSSVAPVGDLQVFPAASLELGAGAPEMATEHAASQAATPGKALAECRFRSEPFVQEVKGDPRRPP